MCRVLKVGCDSGKSNFSRTRTGSIVTYKRCFCCSATDESSSKFSDAEKAFRAFVAAKLENLVALNQVNFHTHIFYSAKFIRQNPCHCSCFQVFEDNGGKDFFFFRCNNYSKIYLLSCLFFCCNAQRAHKIWIVKFLFLQKPSVQDE